jgi:hypothetical protein
MKLHNAMQKMGRANSKTAPAEKAKKERKRRKVAQQVALDPNVEYTQLEASHAANILSLRSLPASSCFFTPFECDDVFRWLQRRAEATDDAGPAAHRGREAAAAAATQPRGYDTRRAVGPRAAAGAFPCV